MNQYLPQSAQLEPTWIAGRRHKLVQIPADIYDWLKDPGSLTARLKRNCKQSFRVRMRSQGWGRALYSEERMLGMRRGEAAIVREIELLIDEVPWVFARTVIPASSLRGPAKRLTMLGTKPLGEVLFADPHTHRVVMEMAHFHTRHNLFHKAVASLDPQPESLWGRRTLFDLAGSPLLVNELFLPALGST